MTIAHTARDSSFTCDSPSGQAIDDLREGGLCELGGRYSNDSPMENAIVFLRDATGNVRETGLLCSQISAAACCSPLFRLCHD